MKKLDSKLKDTRRDFLYKLSTEMSVTTQELFQKLDKFLEWLRIGNYRELFLKNGWRKSRTFLEGKAEKYGRTLRVQLF